MNEQEFQISLDKIPSLKSYKHDLEVLNNLDKSNLSYEAIEKLYFEKAIIFPGKTIVVPANLLNKIKLYRVRTNIDYKKENINLTETYSYPPKEFCKDNGRGNVKGKPVFYSGHTLFTALKESKIKKGDIGYLTTWNINATRNCEYGIFLPKELPKNNPWNIAHSIIKSRTQHRITDSYKCPQLVYLQSFIAQLFLSEKPPYSLTSWMADKMIYGFGFVDFIVYPSFELKSSKCNLAFHPDFVNKFISFEKVYMFKTLDIIKGNVAMLLLFVGIETGDKIEWKPASDEDNAFIERKSSISS